MRDKVIFLVIGAVISVLFGLFSEPVYEALYYSSGFSEAMHNNDAYGIVAIIAIAMTWGIAALYYYVINSVKFDRWYHWMSMLGVASVLTPVVCFVVVGNLLEGMDYPTASATFAVYNVIVSALLFTIASFSMRWWSSNCRHTPIPQ